MPSIDWPALHFASAKAKQLEAEARQRGSEARYRQVVLQAIEETEGALMRYSQSQQRLQALSEVVSESRQAATKVELRYKAGGVPFLTYLAAQRIQLNAEDELVDADTDTFTNVVMVYKSLGGGW
jgi:multidrug efflux system outer membrane protein